MKNYIKDIYLLIIFLFAAMPLLVLVRIAVAFVADEKCPAGLQNPVNLPEAPGQIRPEIDGFKGRHRVEPVVRKHHIRHAALQNGAAPLRDGGLVDLFRLLHADGRIVGCILMQYLMLYEVMNWKHIQV